MQRVGTAVLEETRALGEVKVLVADLTAKDLEAVCIDGRLKEGTKLVQLVQLRESGVANGTGLTKVEGLGVAGTWAVPRANC
ncbi:hypothetical protein Tdes44962_MAKER00971 [Teratosphaeria destructans]|uniref:Uncharacterized protein n=1 Tax=Teratosphaeria destructans TaxID=418781 RepID=A0A9W7SJE7_9PEZI|nr:hypothetical protein Tdes44962_MAKER00971 [Teratosphaeria destructans]